MMNRRLSTVWRYNYEDDATYEAGAGGRRGPLSLLLELDERDNEVSKGVFVCKVQGIEMHGGQPCPRFGLGGDGS